MIPTYRGILAITVLTWRDQLSDSSTITPRKRVYVFLSIGVWEILNGYCILYLRHMRVTIYHYTRDYQVTNYNKFSRWILWTNQYPYLLFYSATKSLDGDVYFRQNSNFDCF